MTAGEGGNDHTTIEVLKVRFEAIVSAVKKLDDHMEERTDLLFSKFDAMASRCGRTCLGAEKTGSVEKRVEKVERDVLQNTGYRLKTVAIISAIVAVGAILSNLKLLGSLFKVL